jgi:hypothetical protein
VSAATDCSRTQLHVTSDDPPAFGTHLIGRRRPVSMSAERDLSGVHSGSKPAAVPRARGQLSEWAETEIVFETFFAPAGHTVYVWVVVVPSVQPNGSESEPLAP